MKSEEEKKPLEATDAPSTPEEGTPSPKKRAPRVAKKKPTFTQEALEEAKRHSFDNETEILRSKEAGCFFCRQIFDARLIQNWIDEKGVTKAICPECGMDAVVGDAEVPLSHALLKEMNEAFYGNDYIASHPDAARAYCLRVEGGQVPPKVKTQNLYFQCLQELTKQGDKQAALRIGDCYRYGLAMVTPPDPEKEEEAYRIPLLKDDDRAMVALASLYESKAAKDADPLYAKKCYQEYAKAAALGNLGASIGLARCYFDGIDVEPDAEMGFILLNSVYSELFLRFAVDRKDWFDFPEAAYEMGLCYAKGRGVEQDDVAALTLFLLSRLSGSIREQVRPGHWEGQWAVSDLWIKTLAKRNGFTPNPPALDENTFGESLGALSSGEVKGLSDISFDSEEHELSFTVDYPQPTLVIDVENLSVGFVSGPTRWTFYDVASVKTSFGDHFQDVTGTYDDGYTFSYINDKGETVPVMEVAFTPDGGRVDLTGLFAKTKDKK